jgi:tripeptidyl-peptidase-1
MRLRSRNIQKRYTNSAIDQQEGNLDAETILGITWPTHLTAYSTGGSPQYLPDRVTVNNTNEPYLTWLQYILAQPDIPHVISTSYGDDEQTVP